MFYIKVKYGDELEEELAGVYESYDDAWCAMVGKALDYCLYIIDNEEHKYPVQLNSRDTFHYNNAHLTIAESTDNWYNVLVTYRVAEMGVDEKPGVYVNVTDGDIACMSVFESREAQIEDFVDRVMAELEQNKHVFSSVNEYSRDDIKRLIKNRNNTSVIGTLMDGWRFDISDLSFCIYNPTSRVTTCVVQSYYKAVK